jgi:nucleotide-binding universal stress UspA family protein
VVEDLSKWEGFYIPHPSLKKVQEDAMEWAEKALERVCEEDMQSCPNFQKIIVTGNPVTEIIKTVESEDMDLVIMGTHGRKGLEHTFFGSVAENVVKKSPVPVLVINPHKTR